MWNIEYPPNDNFYHLGSRAIVGELHSDAKIASPDGLNDATPLLMTPGGRTSEDDLDLAAFFALQAGGSPALLSRRIQGSDQGKLAGQGLSLLSPWVGLLPVDEGTGGAMSSRRVRYLRAPLRKMPGSESGVQGF